MIEINDIKRVFFSKETTIQQEVNKSELEGISGDLQSALLQAGFICEIKIK